MVGATDSHTSLATTREDNYFGKVSLMEPGPDRFAGQIVPDPESAELETYLDKAHPKDLPILAAAARAGCWYVYQAIMGVSDTIRERIARLTPREREVMQMVTEGLSNKEIANTLGVSAKTIEAHRARVMEKMGVRSAAELLHLCHQVDIEPDIDVPTQPD